jgi:hypothetical protein
VLHVPPVNSPLVYYSISSVLFRESDVKGADLLDTRQNVDLEDHRLSGVHCSVSDTFTATSVYEGYVFHLQTEHSRQKKYFFP